MMHKYSLNCNGRLLNIEQPIVMGILNATPDSFFNNGTNSSLDEIVTQAAKMLECGATILDIGGMSTRPGHTPLSEQEEMDRVVPVIETLKGQFPEVYLSVDTFRANVALSAAEVGVDIINDISAGTIDALMIPTVASLGLPYIAMHMKGDLARMQDRPLYENAVKEVLEFGASIIATCRNAGIKDVIFDPGFGFGKTVAHNFQILKHLHVFEMLQVPILAGLSRKSMLYKLLDITSQEALNATTVANTIALQQGAHILRVHDVKEAMECMQLLEYLKTV